MAHFLGKGLDLPRYKPLLLKVYEILAPIESSILRSSFVDSFKSVQDRTYFLALREDLRFLNLSLVLSKASSDMEISSAARLAGALYVLEGSALGGRVLAKSIQTHLGITRETGLGYFSAQSEQGFQRWPNFKREIEQSVAEIDYKECLAVALDVFRRFS